MVRFLRSFFCFVSFFFLFFLHGLACFCRALVPGTPALHLLHLDELRLFGLFRLTAVCDHII